MGLSPWIVVLIAGCTVHLAVNAALWRPLTSGWGLLAPFALRRALEASENWARYQDIELSVPGNDPLAVALGRHAVVVMIMVAAPRFLVSSGVVTPR